MDIIGANGREIPEGDGQIPVWIPLRKEITRGEYRLEAVLDSGERWAANVTVPSVPPTPSLPLEPSAGHVGAVVNFTAEHFPPNTELGVTFWEGHSGRGVFNGMIARTGGLSGSFRIPPIVNSSFTQPGWHDVEAQTSWRPASTRTQFDVTPLPEDQVLELAGPTITTSNGLASLSVSTIRVQRARLTLSVSILNLVGAYPLRLQSISASIIAKRGFYSLVTDQFANLQDEMLQPDSPHRAMYVFVVDQCLTESNPPEVPRLALDAVFKLGEHVGRLTLFRELEDGFLEHLLRDFGHLVPMARRLGQSSNPDSIM